MSVVDHMTERRGIAPWYCWVIPWAERASAAIAFVASAVEDPGRKPATAAGFRGGRYISAEASAHGYWKQGGSAMPGADAYATSKQCTLAAAMEFARETPRLRFNAG